MCCFRRYRPESHCMLFHLKEIMLFSAFILQDFFLIISHRSLAVSQGIQSFIKIYTTQNHFFLKIDLIKFTVSQKFRKNYCNSCSQETYIKSSMNCFNYTLRVIFAVILVLFIHLGPRQHSVNCCSNPSI